VKRRGPDWRAVLLLLFAVVVLGFSGWLVVTWPPEPPPSTVATSGEPQGRQSTGQSTNSTGGPTEQSEPATLLSTAFAENGNGGKVLVLGDSISAGWDAAKPRAAWPQQLLRGLRDDVDGVRVRTVAVPGVTVDGAADLERPRGNDLVVVELGTNDLAVTGDAAAYRSDLRDLLGDLAAGSPDAPIVVLGPWRGPEVTAGFDEAGRALCERQGCTYVALAAAYAEAGPIPAGQPVARGTSDGQHPGSRGHAAIADLVLETLTQPLDAS
jgi:lysophospholipase L1-like esterase